jgi:fibronectin-binding autotransporter adhesin
MSSTLRISSGSASRRNSLRRKHQSLAPSVKRRRLLFESLEDRRLLASFHWTGAVDGNWGTPGNWQENSAPQQGSEHTLVFDTDNVTGPHYSTNNNITGLTHITIQIVDSNPAAGADFTLSGNAVGLSAAGLTHTTGAATDGTTISLQLTGSGGITTSGSGTLTLSGANAFTGNVAVDGGTAKIGHMNAFGAHNTAVTKVVVASGGAVDFNGRNDAVYGYTISGDGVGGTGALLNTGGSIGTNYRQASNITLAADASIGGTGNWALLTSSYAATTLNLAGYTLTKVGTNTFTLANATITAGSIRIAGGTISQIGNNKPGGHDASAVALTLDDTAGAMLNLNNLNLSVGSISGGGTAGGGVELGSGRLTVGALNTTTTYSGTISGSGSLTKAGAGTMRLNNGRSFSGGTTISQGAVLFSNGSAFGSGAVTLNDANTGSLDTAMLATGALTIGNSIVVANQGTGTSTIGTSQFDPGANPTVFSGSVTLNKNTTFTGGSTDRTTYTGVISGTPGTVVVSGGRRTTWDNTNTFVGDVGISGAGTILQLNGSTNVIPDASKVDVGAGAFLYSNNASETIAGLTGSGRVQKHPNVNASFALTVGYGDASSTFDGVITNGNNVLSLTKIGSGTLTLTGNNAYTGVTRISGGTLSVPRLSKGAVAGPLGAAPGLAANLIFDSGALQYTGSASYVGTSAINRPFTVQAGGGTIEIAHAAATVEFDSSAGANSPVGSSGRLTLTGVGNGMMTQILGSSLTGGVLKSGTGTWTLNPAVVHNSYLPASPGTAPLLTGRTVADLDGIAAGVMNGGFIGSNQAAAVYNYSNDGNAAQFALAFFDGTYTKAVKIQLADSAGNVVGSILSARYWNGNVLSPAFNYDTTSGGNVQSIATSDGAGGYGAKSLTLLVSTDSNAYSGGTTIRQGTLRATHSGSVGTGEVTLGDAGTGSEGVAWLIAAQARLANPAVVSDQGSGPATLGSYSVGPAAEFSGPLTLDRPVTLTDATDDRTTFSGQITGDVGTITIAGNRVALANGNNDFVGGLTVSSGSIYQNDASGAIPDGTSVLVDGVFQLNGVDETIDALNGSGTIRNHAGANTLTLGAAGGSGTFTGRILDGSGTLSLIKTGAGSQMLAPLTGSTTYDATFVPATPATVVVLPNVDLADVAGVSSAIMNGGSISPQNAPAAAYNFFNDGARATFAIAIFQGGYTKAVKIQLTRSGSHVVATALSARYWSGNVLSDSFNYDTTSGPNNSSIAISDGAGGYGCKSLTLTLAQPYTGATTVNGGTLLVNGWISSDATVNDGATLGGNGTITGSVTVNSGGFVSPGSSPGILGITGPYSQSGTLKAEIVRPATTPVAGDDYDQVNVTGTVSLDESTSVLDLSFTGSGTVPTGNLFTLIDNDGVDAVTGSFSAIVENGGAALFTTNLPGGGVAFTANSQSWVLFYNGGTGNDVTLTTTPALAPATVYVSPAWSTLTNGSLIVDADFGTGGNQPAVFGFDAFTTIDAALAAVSSSGTIIVNGGTYAEAVSLDGTQTLRITGPDAIQTVAIDSLATAVGQSVVIQGESNLTVGDANNSVIAGTISGSGNLTKTGTGGLTLTGANTYTGATTVDGGTLEIGGGGTTGSLSAASAIAVNAAGTLIHHRSDNVNFSNSIAGTGNVVRSGGGNWVLQGTNSFSGTITTNSGGALVFGSLGAEDGVPDVHLNSGWLVLAAAFVGDTATIGNLTGTGTIEPYYETTTGVRTLSVQQTADGSFSGTINGGSGGRQLAVTKTGSAMLTISGTGSTNNTAGGCCRSTRARWFWAAASPATGAGKAT